MALRLEPVGSESCFISQILEAEATLARGDNIVEEMRREAQQHGKAGDEKDGR
jgi:hypothetical protein